MEILQKKISENNLILQKLQKTRLNQKIENFEFKEKHKKNLLSPFLFAWFYHADDSQHIKATLK